MNTIFSSPLAFIAFSAIPALVVIYLLRSRFRIHNVSSLMLWEVQKKARKGGLHISRIQTPLLFLLELLTIIMLVLAAAGPMVRSNKDTRVFIIVLDNSFSMLANDGTTPRDRAIGELKKLLTESGDFQARFILAGKTPQLLGEPVKKTSKAIDILDSWKCLAPIADLDQAITLGAELAGKTARMLVITDHKPDNLAKQGRLEWWAFGKPLSNLAFVNANKTSFEGKDRCFLAVANLSDKPTKTTLIVESLDSSQKIMQKSVELKSNQVYRTFFEPKIDSIPLQARLEHDSLDIDNEIILLSEPPKPLRIQVKIQNEPLRLAVHKAIDAAKITHLTSIEPQLLITDVPQPASAGLDLWTAQIISEPNAAAYLGPFVLDRSHPLSQGLLVS